MTYFLLMLSDENVLVVDNHTLQKVFFAWHVLSQQSTTVLSILLFVDSLLL